MSDRLVNPNLNENIFKKNHNSKFKILNKEDLHEKKNSYVPPHKKKKETTYRTQFKNNNYTKKKSFLQDPSFNEKEGDFPILNDEIKIPESDNSITSKVSFVNLVKNIEKPEIKENLVNLDLVKPGWIRWWKLPQSGKWIEEPGKKSKRYKNFVKWFEDYKYIRKIIVFENYLDLLEQRELDELELNGPKYINSWDLDSEPEYESEIEEFTDSSDSECLEYIDENNYN